MHNKLLVSKTLRVKALFILAVIAFFFVPTTVSASSNTLNFQSKIVNLVDGTNIDTGTPACVVAGNGNDTCDFRVNIYDDPSAGNLLFSEDHTDTEIGHYNGIFNLEINSVCNVVSDTGTDGNWTDVGNGCISNGGVDFSATDLWIEIEFDPTGTSTFSETFSRVEIRDVASARYAVHASYVDGFTSGDFVFFKPNAVQTTTSTNTLINLETTANTANPLLVFNENGAGTPDLLRLQNTGNSVFTVANDGRVGVFVAPTADTALRIESALQSTYNAGNYDPLTVITTNDTTGGRTYGVRSVINTGAANAPGSLRALRGEILYSSSGSTGAFIASVSGFSHITAGTASGTFTGLASTSRNTSGTVGTLQSINSFAENLAGGTTATFQNGYYSHTNAGIITGRMANHSLFSSNTNTVGEYYLGTELFLLNSATGFVDRGMIGFTSNVGNDGIVDEDLSGIQNLITNSVGATVNQTMFGLRTQVTNDGTILGDLIGYDYALFNTGTVTGNTFGYRGSDPYSTVILNDFTNSLSISASGDVALNGGVISTTNAGTLDMFANNVTTLNFGRTGANGTLNLMGGDSDTGCTLNGVTGDFSCTGTIIGSVSGAFFEDGGNSFGGTAVLGTNDTFNLEIETDGTTAIIIDTNQDVDILQSLTVGSNFYAQAFSGFGTAPTSSAFATFAEASVNEASINIATSTGVDVAAPNSGDLWWNGTELFFYDGSTNIDLLAGGACATCFVDGGNTFGATGVVGTNDNFGLDIETNNTTAISIANNQDITLFGNLNSLGFNGIGDTFSTSTLARFGAATAAYSSMRITTSLGTDVAAPVNGDLWWNGVELFFYDGTTNVDLLAGGCATCFEQGGNTFGATGVVGTNDNFGLDIETNGTTAISIANNQDITLLGNLNSLGFNGIGDTFSTSTLARFGAATAGYSSMRITNSLGTDVAAPVNGDLWWNGVELFFYDGTTNVDLLAGGGNFFEQGGNTFGANAILGTNDNFSLAFETNGTTHATLSTAGDLTLNNDLAVNGGDLTTTSGTATLFNAGATTLNIGGAATTLTLGISGASGTLDLMGGNASTGCTVDGTAGNFSCTNNATFGGDLAVNGGDITTTSATANLFQANATTVNIGGASNTINLGGGSGSTGCTLDATTGDLDCSGLINGVDLAQAFIQNGNSFGAGAVLGTNDNFSLSFETNGTTQATLSTAGDLTLNNDLAVNGGDLTTTAATFNLLNTNATTVNAFGAATTVSLGIAGASGTMDLMGGSASTGCTVDGTAGNFTCTNNGVFGGDVAVNGGDLTTTSGTGNVFNTNATTVNVGGASNTINLGGGSASTGCTLDATTGNLVCTGTYNGVDVTQAFIQNGNSFGGAAVLGTNDNFSLSFETNGTTQATLSTAGDLTLNNDLYVIGTTGLGTTASASSWLDIGANTTTVAQLNLTPSAAVDVTAPNAGDLWFNGTNLYFDDGTTTYDLLAGSPCITCFHDGGDSFGAGATLGTNDNFALAFETNGTTRLTLDTSGHLTPFVDNTYDLGSLSNRFRDLYLGPGSLKITSTTGTGGTGANYTLLESGFNGGAARFVTTNNGTNTAGNFGAINFQSGMNTGQTTNAAFDFRTTANLGAADELFQVSDNNGTNEFLTIDGGGTVHFGSIAGSTCRVFGPAGQLNCSTLSINSSSAFGGAAVDFTTYLNIREADAATSSLRINDSGAVDVAAPVSGDLWWNGTELFFYDGTTNVDLLAGTACPTCFEQGGNSFAATAILGTNDNFNLEFETNGTSRLTLDTSGHLTPLVDDTYDLGSTTNRFRDLYLGPATLNIGTSGDDYDISYDAAGVGTLVFNEAGEDDDLRIEGDTDANLFFVDASLGRIGVGTSTPLDYKFNVVHQDRGIVSTGTSAFNLAGPIFGRQATNSMISSTTVNSAFTSTSALFVSNSYNGAAASSYDEVVGLQVQASDSTPGTAKTVASLVAIETEALWQSAVGGVTNTIGLRVVGQSSGVAKSITNQYGIYVENMIDATNDYAIYVEGAGTYSIWVDSGDSRLDGDLEVNGGDLTTTAATFNLLNTNATTLNFGGAATTVNIGVAGASGTMALMGGSASTGCTLDGTTGDFTCAGDVAVNGGDLLTTSATANVFNTVATTVNIGGAATTINLGGGSGSTGCTIDGSGNFSCSGTGGDFFRQNGNSFGATAVLGTNDANSLTFETSGTTRLTLDTSGHLTPLVDDTYDLGSSTNRFRDLYLGPATLNIGNSTDDYDISFDTAGVGSLVFNEAGEDDDLRIEGDTNANLFVIDASTDRIGIGTASPSAFLSIGASSQLQVNTTGELAQTLASTTTIGNTMVMNSLTSGRAIDITSTATAFTGDLQRISLTGNNAANTGDLLELNINGASNAATGLRIVNTGTGVSLAVDSGRITHTFAGTTTTANTVTLNSLTTGRGLDMTSTATAFTGAMQRISLTGNNAANTGDLLTLSISGAASAARGLFIDNRGTGLSLRIDDQAADSSPFAIDADGFVGIGALPNSAYKVLIQNTITDTAAINQFGLIVNTLVNNSAGGIAVGNKAGQFQVIAGTGANPMGSIAAITSHVGTTGAGTASILESNTSGITVSSGATVTTLANYGATTNISGGSTITDWTGVSVYPLNISGGATVANAVGIRINTVAGATTNTGLLIEGATQFSLLVNSGLSRFNGTVEINGTTTIAADLSVTGDIFAVGAATGTGNRYVCMTNGTSVLLRSTTACNPSSLRFKENISDLDYGLNEILALRPVFYHYKPEFDSDTSKQIGFIAEELALILPELGAYEEDGVTLQGLDYPKLTAVNTKAIQELNSIVVGNFLSLSAEDMNMYTLLNGLEDRVVVLEDDVDTLGLTVDAQNTSLTDLGNAVNSHATDLLNLATADVNQMNLYNALEGTVAAIDSRLITVEGLIAGFTYQGQIDALSVRVTALENGGVIRGTTTVTYVDNVTVTAVPFGQNITNAIVTASPVGFDGKFKIQNITATGFEIVVTEMNPAPLVNDQIIFNWIVAK